jgi:hypothetical protein
VGVRFTLSSVHKVPSSRPRSRSERRRILAYFGNLGKVHLLLVSRMPIQRHVKVKGEANPYHPRLRNLLRETRRGSYGGDVSGYSKTSLSLEVPTRALPRMQYMDHPNTGWRLHHRFPRVMGGPRVPRTAFCFIQTATTGFTAKGFLYHYRVSPKEVFKGPEPDDGRPSRPVLRGPAPSNGGRLLGSGAIEIFNSCLCAPRRRAGSHVVNLQIR